MHVIFNYIVLLDDPLQAERIADAINSTTDENYHRSHRAVSENYKLSPGFEP